MISGWARGTAWWWCGARETKVTLVECLMLTILIVSASIGGLMLVRHWMLAAELKGSHDVADPLSQVVGMMFAVLLGFMVGDAMQRFAQARATAQQEAASLCDVYNLAVAIPADKRAQVRSLCVQYAELVVKQEWPLLAQRQTSAAAQATFVELSNVCSTYEPKSQGQSNVQQSLLPSVVSLGDNRRLRCEALNNGLPPALWAVLLIGGLATVLFTYFFGAGNLKIQLVMVSIVTVVICLNIFLLASYDDPFSGDVMVHPTAFEEDLRIFQTEEAKSAIGRK
jgi:hypothetical protein